MKSFTEIKTEVADFPLRLPAIFDIKPSMEVELPGGRKALIFDVQVEKYEGRNQEITKLVPGWRIVIVNRRGIEDRGQYENRDCEFTNALSASLYLRRVAAFFAKKKRSQHNTTDYDDE